MNKFDPDSSAILMAIIEAEGRHPEPTDGDMKRFSLWNQPLVHIGEIYGQAVGYTHSYGLITWRDDNKQDHLEWFPATQIQRVDPKDWKGNGTTR